MNVQSAIPSPQGTSLASAIVALAGVPSVLLDAGSKVVTASTSFCRTFLLDPRDIAGRPFSELGAGEWAAPSIGAMLASVAASGLPRQPIVIDFTGRDRVRKRLVVDAHKLDHDDFSAACLLVTITDAQAATSIVDELIRAQTIHRQEVQHRIANSLQIIASVLMHSARRAQTPDVRRPLREAYNRVMSVAEVQQQLAISSADTIALQPYLGKLCGAIDASLVRDSSRLQLDVDVDASKVSGDRAVSLGLIVTELVINALKHAFHEDDAAGRITISYRSSGDEWRLSVSDSGAGMRNNADGGVHTGGSGLGSSIIDALARKLDARVAISNTQPGTSVSVFHDA